MRSSARVLLLVENNAYPFDVRVRREAHALRDGGYRVSVIAPRASGQSWSERLDGIDVHRFPAPRGGEGLWSYVYEFAYATLAMCALSCWVALRRGVDVVHAANPPDTLFLIGALFRLFGVRFVFDHHDLAPETYLSRFGKPGENLVSRTLRLLERCSFKVANIVIATNESYKAIAIERGGKQAQHVFVVRNGPSRDFRPLPPDPALAARARHIIGYIGTMGPQDGVDHWLRAIQHMVVTLGRRDFLAVLIGSGDAARSLKALAAELQIEPFVWFTGRIPDIEARTCLSTASVCVHPDPLNPLNDRSTMNKMMEYMALGKPTVSFDLKEARHSAQDAAIYAEPNDDLQFAECVCWLLDHPEQARHMGERGRQRVHSTLAWEFSVKELLRAYDEGLGLGASAPPVPMLEARHRGTAMVRYVLVTPARNEAEYIERTIHSVIAQRTKPLRWVIVSDGSTDGTDEIVEWHTARYPWIELVKVPPRVERHFAGKVQAFNAGYSRLAGLDYDVIGSLDADISFDEGYFEFILSKFADDKSLGVAGTPFQEDGRQYDYRFTNIEHVSGACQMFRKACFESIGGYRPVVGGGIDWIAVTTARMNGWKTRTFVEKVCHHHRPIGTAQNSELAARFRLGRKDYALGGHPLWEVFRSLYQMRSKPVVLGGICLMSGYTWAWLSRCEMSASPDLIRFHRQEQLSRLRHFLRLQRRPLAGSSQ